MSTLNPIRRGARAPRARTLSTIAFLALALSSVAGCELGAGETRTLELRGVNDSGVSGTIEFTVVGRKTAVTIRVDPAGNLDMPAHIHPGTCDDMVPQPKFPLESVKDGSSSTVVPATIDELFAGGLALNIHKSNDEMKISTACVGIG